MSSLKQSGDIGVVDRAFGFLVSQSGFAKVGADAGVSVFVRYQRADIFVDVSWDPSAHELEVLLGQAGVDDATGSSGFNLLSCMKEMQLEVAVAEDRATRDLAESTKWWAALLRRMSLDDVGPLLEALRLLRIRRAHQHEAWLADMDAARLRRQADEAWERKDYAALIAAYESMARSLLESEVHRLAFARKQMGGNPAGGW